jgi:hypothetical protein
MVSKRTRKNSGKRAGTRKNNGPGTGIISRVWGPFGHFFIASGESAKKIGNTAGTVVKESMNAFKGVGNTFTRHANMAVKGVIRGRSHKNGRRSRRHRR